MFSSSPIKFRASADINTDAVGALSTAIRQIYGRNNICGLMISFFLAHFSAFPIESLWNSGVKPPTDKQKSYPLKLQTHQSR